jgi:hypothetical protein
MSIGLDADEKVSLPPFRNLTPGMRPLALGLQASSQKKMRALFVIHSGSRPKRSWELEEVYDHVGEMVRRPCVKSATDPKADEGAGSEIGSLPNNAA